MLREFKAITFYSKTLHLWNFISTSVTNTSTISQQIDTELNIRQLFKPPVLIVLNHTKSYFFTCNTSNITIKTTQFKNEQS